MTFIVRALIKFGILKNDLDYHLLRASMVIIFLFFGYQKWFEYEAQALLPYIGHGPLIFWTYSVFGVRGATLLPRSRGVAGRRTLVSRILEQEVGDSRGSWILFCFYRNFDNHSVHAGRLGRFRWRIPRDD